MLVKLRISNHKLMIEIGRYNQVSKDNRTCPICGSNQIEDETHFLFYCSKYSSIRNEFYKKIQFQLPNIKFLPINELIIELMNTSNYLIIIIDTISHRRRHHAFVTFQWEDAEDETNIDDQVLAKFEE